MTDPVIVGVLWSVLYRYFKSDRKL